MTAIRNNVIEVYSDLNDCIDAMFVVPEKDVYRATEILDKAMDSWWDEGESEAYGDWLERALHEAGIEYEVFYKSA